MRKEDGIDFAANYASVGETLQYSTTRIEDVCPSTSFDENARPKSIRLREILSTPKQRNLKTLSGAQCRDTPQD